MHTLRTHASIHHTAQHHHDPSLRKLISKRIEELSEYTEDLAELIHIHILEPGDTWAWREPDVIESHPGWYEITIVLSDDGFGEVLYVPKHPDADPKLLELCQSAVAAGTNILSFSRFGNADGFLASNP